MSTCSIASVKTVKYDYLVISEIVASAEQEYAIEYQVVPNRMFLRMIKLPRGIVINF